jgi:amidase
MNELIDQSVVTLAEAIRQKKVSSREVVSAYLGRIEAVNPRLNAVVRLLPEQALKQAQEADEALARGQLTGPLHGVPMTIKDSLDTAGVITTGGTEGRRYFVPEQDATVVARLKAAGAILMGKTNTPQLTLNFETNNTIFGRTVNPYDETRTCGGSSGGAAAIIASSGSPFDIGSDYGGSIRLPAHFCGIAGIKPTSGRVPRTGHIIPFASGAADAFQQIGPLARKVADLGLLLSIIAGPDWMDPAVVPMPLGDSAAVDLKQLKVVFFTDNGAATPIPEIIQTVNTVALALQQEGLAVEEKCPERLDESWAVWLHTHFADGGGGVREILRNSGTPQDQWNDERLSQWAAKDTAEFGLRLRETDRFRSRMLQFMAPYDVMLCPVNANVALPHGTTYQHSAGYSYTITHNITGWPGVVVRAGTSSEGLPIGVQILAKPWREDVALAVAQLIETLFGGWQPPAL